MCAYYIDGIFLVYFQTYSKEAVDHVQEALTHAQKIRTLSASVFEVTDNYILNWSCLILPGNDFLRWSNMIMIFFIMIKNITFLHQQCLL